MAAWLMPVGRDRLDCPLWALPCAEWRSQPCHDMNGMHPANLQHVAQDFAQQVGPILPTGGHRHGDTTRRGATLSYIMYTSLLMGGEGGGPAMPSCPGTGCPSQSRRAHSGGRRH